MALGIIVTVNTLVIILSAFLIINQNKTIMAKQSEEAAKLQKVATDLAATKAQVEKIGTETDGLKQTILDLKTALENQENASQELTDAVAAVETAAGSVSSAVAGVDDKVEDAPETPEEPTV